MQINAAHEEFLNWEIEDFKTRPDVMKAHANYLAIYRQFIKVKSEKRERVENEQNNLKRKYTKKTSYKSKIK